MLMCSSIAREFDSPRLHSTRLPLRQTSLVASHHERKKQKTARKGVFLFEARPLSERSESNGLLAPSVVEGLCIILKCISSTCSKIPTTIYTPASPIIHNNA